MAVLALAAVGSAIGGAVTAGTALAAYGASAGWLVGSMLGNALFTKGQKIEGPRINDLKVQVSSWGVPIPIYYGSMRGAGNVIWSTPIIEHVKTTRRRAKGGPKITTTTYTYTVSFALALCEGEILGVRKIWADGRLIYNVGNNVTAETLAESNRMASGFKVYTGSHSQMPDPTIEAYLGVGNVSAHRGLAYLVFDGMLLTNYGNRIPNIEVEVVKDGTVQMVKHEWNPSTRPARSGCITNVDLSAEYIVQFHSKKSPIDGDNSRALEVWHLYPDVAVLDATYALGDHHYNYGIASGVSDEPAVLMRKVSPISSVAAHKMTLMYPDGTSREYSTDVNGNEEPAEMFAKIGEYLLMQYDKSAGGSALSLYRVDSVYRHARVEVPDTPRMVMLTEEWAWSIRPDGGNLLLERRSLVDLSLDSTFSIPGYSSLASTSGGVWRTDGENLYALEEVSGSWALCKITPDGTLTELHNGLPLNVTSAECNAFDFSDIAVLGVDTASSNAVPATVNLYEIVDSSVLLSSIVSAQLSRSGISSDDYDMSALTDQVEGYAITRQGTARANIEQLQKAFFFDPCETDYKLKFVKRGGAVAVEIPFEELGAFEYGGQPPNPVDVTRQQEVDLPQEVTVNYLQASADYQVGTERASRLVTESSQKASVDLAIAMSSDHAAKIADVLLYDAHAARTPVRFSTTKKYAKYQPTDIFIVHSQSASYRVRIVKKDEAGPIINWEGVTDDATVYNSSAEGGGDGQSQTQIVTPGPTNAQYLDIPIVRDEDNDAGFYVAMGGYKSAWRGATLLQSPDDANYGEVGSVMNNATIGTCDNALGNWTGGNIFDESNALNVTLTSGELESLSIEQVLNGGNAAVVGNEIIQFRSAVLTAPNKYRITGILRGCRGTEQHIGTHVAGERFVLLTVAGTLRSNPGTAWIGAPMHYKPVSFGQSVFSVPARQFTNTAVGLKPYSPVNLRGGKQVNGDFVLAWDRRTRIDGGWRNGVDAALGEASEAYEIDIMDGAAVKRTLTSSTATVTYTAAMGTADFGAPPANLTAIVYQMSAVVGRGFPATKTY